MSGYGFLVDGFILRMRVVGLKWNVQSRIGLETAMAPIPGLFIWHSVRPSIVARPPPIYSPYTPIRGDRVGSGVNRMRGTPGFGSCVSC